MLASWSSQTLKVRTIPLEKESPITFKGQRDKGSTDRKEEMPTHRLHATTVSKRGVITEGSLLLSTEVVGDGVRGGNTRNVGHGVCVSFAVLNIESANFSEGAFESINQDELDAMIDERMYPDPMNCEMRVVVS